MAESKGLKRDGPRHFSTGHYVQARRTGTLHLGFDSGRRRPITVAPHQRKPFRKRTPSTRLKRGRFADGPTQKKRKRSASAWLFARVSLGKMPRPLPRFNRL